MTSKEFVLWLKGFTDALPTDGPATLKQWTTLKDKLEEVSDEQQIGVPIGEGGLGVPNTQPFPKWQEPHTYYPNVEIPCVNPIGTVPATGFIVTTSPGYGSITYNPSTSTTYGYPSGSAWNYTNGEK